MWLYIIHNAFKILSGSQNDSSIFIASQLGQDLLSNNLNLPEARPLPFKDRPQYPFWLVADQAFPLSEHILSFYKVLALRWQEPYRKTKSI